MWSRERANSTQEAPEVGRCAAVALTALPLGTAMQGMQQWDIVLQLWPLSLVATGEARASVMSRGASREAHSGGRPVSTEGLTCLQRLVQQKHALQPTTSMCIYTIPLLGLLLNLAIQVLVEMPLKHWFHLTPPPLAAHSRYQLICKKTITPDSL